MSLGRMVDVELKPGGSTIPVTNEVGHLIISNYDCRSRQMDGYANGDKMINLLLLYVNVACFLFYRIVRSSLAYIFNIF